MSVFYFHNTSFGVLPNSESVEVSGRLNDVEPRRMHSFSSNPESTSDIIPFTIRLFFSSQYDKTASLFPV